MPETNRRQEAKLEFAAAGQSESSGLDEFDSPEQSASVTRWWRSAIAPLGRVLEHERANWFLWAPVAFATGAGLYFSLKSEPPLVVAFLVCAVAIAFRVLAAGRSTPVVASLNVLILIALGFACAKLRTETVRHPVLKQDTAEIQVLGFVEAIKPRGEGKTRFTLHVTSLGDFREDTRPGRIRVSSRMPVAGIEVGHGISAWVKLRPPAGPAAPDDYDFARYAWFKEIGAVGYVTRPPVRADIDAERPLTIAVFARIAEVRRAISQRIAGSLEGQTAGIATALITGERGEITEATNQAYRDAGLYHVLSISGLHMAIMGGAVFFAARFLLALFPLIALRFDIKKWAAVAALVGSFGYLLISGGAFATIRSFLMIAVMFIAILFDRPALALRNVALAALIILVAFPESVLDPGFQMSFAAVVALVAGYGAYENWRRDARGGGEQRSIFSVPFRLLAGIILSTVFASIAVTPIALYHFHQSQHLAVIANAVAMPICNLIVMPMALATLVTIPIGLEALPLMLMGVGIDLMSATARWVAGIDAATGRYPAFPLASLVLMAFGGLLLALMSHRLRLFGVPVAAAGVFLAVGPSMPDAMISQEGTVVAVRSPEGRMNFLASRKNDYLIDRWLERDGDGRTAEQVRNKAGFACDTVGCTAKIGSATLAVPLSPDAYERDCALADVIVFTARHASGSCQRSGKHPLLAIDPKSLVRTGAIAIFIEGEQAGMGFASADADVIRLPEADPRTSPESAPRLRIVTVRSVQGKRPWSTTRH